jgi:hypothetical protein
MNLCAKSKIIKINGSKPDESKFILTPNMIINIKFKNSIFKFSESITLAAVEYGGYFSNNKCDRCIINGLINTHCKYFDCKLNNCYLILPSDIKFELNLMSMLNKFKDDMTSRIRKSLVRTLRYSLCNPDLCYNYYGCRLKDTIDSVIDNNTDPVTIIPKISGLGMSQFCVFKMAVKNIEKCNHRGDLMY